MATPTADSYTVAAGVRTVRLGHGTPPPVATIFTLSGPATGTTGVVATFTVTHTGTLPGTVTITPSDGAGGEFWPLDYAADKSVTLSPSKPSAVFFYAPGVAGSKTITLTNNAGLTNPSGHSYTASAYAAPSATPFRLTRGGSTIGSYATLQQCKDAGGYLSGDVIKVTGGTYVVFGVTDPGNLEMTNNPGGVQMGVEINTLTVEWETPGQPMVLDYSRSFMVSMWSGGQPQVATMGAGCRNLTLRGIHIRGARPATGTSWFGAAVWTKLSGAAGAASLTLEYCKISECPDGVKTQDGRYDLSVYVRNSVFVDNSDNRGLDHDIYTGKNALTHVEGCTFRKTANNPYPQLGMGHFLKSRCRQTVVRGNLFDGYMTAGGIGGVAQSINTPNGGAVEITGNVILYYGSLTTDGNGNPLRYGDDQHTATVDTSTDPSLTTHSLLFAQNTVRQYLGRSADGAEPRVLQIYPTGVATTLLDGAGTQVAVTATVRNNIVAYDTPGSRLTQFLSDYPNNSTVSVGTISGVGLYSGAAIAGSPSVNDAPLEWAGELIAATSRSDTNRGGRNYMPSWVPSTAWQWADIPGTIWADYMPNTGAGIAPAVTSLDPGPSRAYVSTWDYSGPTYSKKNHEFWMFGGGHAGTTINCVTRYELHKNSPNVVMACLPSTEAVRNSETLGSGYATFNTSSYYSDGKPHSPHSYHSNLYLDSVDKFVSFGLAAQVGSSDGGATLNGGSGGNTAIAVLPRAGTWASADTFANFPSSVITYAGDRGLRAIAEDGSAIYYWVENQFAPQYGLNKYTIGTNTHTYIGGVGYLGAKCSDEQGGKVLIVDKTQASGWVGRYVNVSTGAATPITFTINGSALPTTMGMFDMTWVSDLGYYLVVWYNSGLPAWPDAPGNLTNIVISKLTPTGSSTMTVDTMTIAAGSGVPTRASAMRGAFYDPAYQCLLLCLSHSAPIKAIKVN